ncbi:MAG: PIG-L deacetylase family protein [Chloroflexota bacterium]
MKILVFVAHPDDETVFTGGTLALLARAGGAVHYLLATRGEGGEMGEPQLCERSDLGQQREKEMRCAVQALGGSGLSFLDYIDPLAGEDDQLFPYTDDLENLTHQLVKHIQALKPVAFISHGSNGEYGHPAHRISHAAASRAVDALGDTAPLFYTFSASFNEHPRPRLINKKDPAHIVVDVASAHHQKTNAALCHRSQNALFVRRSSKRAGRPLTIAEVLADVESLHRVYPPVKNGTVNDLIAQALQPWVKDFSISDSEQI